MRVRDCVPLTIIVKKNKLIIIIIIIIKHKRTCSDHKHVKQFIGDELRAMQARFNKKYGILQVLLEKVSLKRIKEIVSTETLVLCLWGSIN